MKIMPSDDYYVWYCDWCDSRNLTLRTRVEKGEVSCGACHKQFQQGSLFNAEKECPNIQAIL